MKRTRNSNTALKTSDLITKSTKGRTASYDSLTLSCDELAVSVFFEFLDLHTKHTDFTPVSNEQLGGGIDQSIAAKYKPVFFAARRGDILEAVASGHLTSEKLFHIRLIEKHKECLYKNAKLDLHAKLIRTAVNLGCSHTWVLATSAAEKKFYNSLGYEEYGEHRNSKWVYLFKAL